MSTHEAANGFVSGELLLRSDENDDRCLPPALEKRLRDSLRGRVARKRCGRSLRRAAILREAAAERRGATVASIAAAKTRGEGLVEEGRAAARRAARAPARLIALAPLRRPAPPARVPGRPCPRARFAKQFRSATLFSNFVNQYCKATLFTL